MRADPAHKPLVEIVIQRPVPRLQSWRLYALGTTCDDEGADLPMTSVKLDTRDRANPAKPRRLSRVLGERY